ncbi:MAG: type VI secretion system baseplate subunit TssG [Deltaproteobacteria bacterium]|jgi:type VI secretion system protein ImpH|nr:type VI secretion system baseplate subunit TssG [Deltaproteobacteria bacterium]
MADPTWLQEDNLIDSLQNEPGEFDYFQAIRLLAQLKPELDLSDFLESELAIRATPSLGFAGRDLLAFEKDPWRFTAGFLGLYGASSPLPSLYSQSVLSQSLDDETSIRDFLDILAAPFYRLQALAHFHNHLPLRLLELADPDGLRILRDLMGPGGTLDRIGRLALWARHSRPAQGLGFLLDSLLGMEGLIEELVPRVAPIPTEDRIQLGQIGLGLGQGALVGSETVDIRSKFRIHLSPPDRDAFLELLPGGETSQKAASLLAAYNQEPLIGELALSYRPEPEETLCLGDGQDLAQKRGGLGRDAFLAPPPDYVFLVYAPLELEPVLEPSYAIV